MDFSYDTPQRESVLQPSSSSWLIDEDKKRPREAVDRTEVFSFGSKSPTMGTSGAFLFHQPLAPTIAGPDVEMSSDTTPIKAIIPETARVLQEQAQEDSSLRPLASSGALTRVSRYRGAGGKRGTEQKKSQSGSQTRSSGRRKAKAVQEGEWEDDEVDEEAKSLWKREGGTTNIQYVFGGGNSTQHPDRPRHSSMLDPEWCLGMAQFAFSVMLLFGVLWLIWGVVRTLQRDVADKVREYELGEWCLLLLPLPVSSFTLHVVLQNSCQRSKHALIHTTSTSVAQTALYRHWLRHVLLGRSVQPKILPLLVELEWQPRLWPRLSMDLLMSSAGRVW